MFITVRNIGKDGTKRNIRINLLHVESYYYLDSEWCVIFNLTDSLLKIDETITHIDELVAEVGHENT